MQVSPCGHQSLCRLCFVHNIREAVANRDLPLRCLICNAKIARVKNNRSGNGTGPEHPVHVRGQTTKQLSPPSSLKGITKNRSFKKWTLAFVFSFEAHVIMASILQVKCS